MSEVWAAAPTPHVPALLTLGYVRHLDAVTADLLTRLAVRRRSSPDANQVGLLVYVSNRLEEIARILRSGGRPARRRVGRLPRLRSAAGAPARRGHGRMYLRRRRIAPHHIRR